MPASVSAGNPEARYSSREAVQLAFVALIQQMPPRQRAVLLLCDVLGWSAAETAALLGGTTASVNGALQRSRETLAKRYPDGRPPLVRPPNLAQQQLLDRYLQAWEGRDLDGFVSLLTEDATYTMPPLPQWYAGRAPIRAFFRMEIDAPWTAHSIHVLSLDQDAIASLTLFAKPTGPQLFDAFGLPLTIAD
jgi:RNA polymerase sigma-70 factor (ECF subfamily)